MELELEQEKINLIKKIITTDKKYIDNEDLFDDFFNETYKRSLLVMKTVKNEASLEAYLKKIVTTAIINVLKDSGRVRRTKEGFKPTEEQSLEQKVSIPYNQYSNVSVNYDIVDLRDGPEEIVIKKETLQTLLDAVSIAHNNNPAKQYMQLYELRYVKGLKQKQIAKELNLSQSEVSKRLLELIEEVKKAFNKN
ncbi:MAG: sigma-70 family RNA polymerase sigma factor [Candidatus Gastranaerophilales bacterium]|nr:sigma-70 family RNA polymerase sigma factor [Candidatus Gastranaerophilales bacterium]